MNAFRRQFSTGYIDTHDGNPNVSPAQSSVIVAILSAGTFFGALLAAPMGDRLGRRISLIIAVAIFSFGVLLQTIAMAITLLVLGRYVLPLAPRSTDLYMVINSTVDSSPASAWALYLFLSLYTNLKWPQNGFEEL